MITVIKHAPHEGLGTFEKIFGALGEEIHIIEAWEARAADDVRWKQAADAERLVVMGGAMGVYEADRYPFLKEELKLLKRRISADLPTLGICLGSQLLAAAAGATVAAAGRREVGWFPVRLTTQGRSDRVVGGLDWRHPVLHWHGDSFEIPSGALHLMASDRFAQQAFVLGKRVYGLQFHPEVPAADLPDWFAADAALPYGRVDGVQSQDEILRGGAQHAEAMAALSRKMLSRLVDDVWR